MIRSKGGRGVCRDGDVVGAKVVKCLLDGMPQIRTCRVVIGAETEAATWMSEFGHLATCDYYYIPIPTSHMHTNC